MRQCWNKQKTKFIYIYILHIKLNNSIYSCAITYSHTVNVNLMLICIELSEM